MTGQRKVKEGIYLVVDPAPGGEYLFPKVEKALKGGIDMLQVWNHWNEDQNKTGFINALCRLAHRRHVPVLINEEWELVKTTALNGVHFDTLPADICSIRQDIGRPVIMGITCGNDLQRIQWAMDNRLDYVSFCSMFPSASAGACEIVSAETVKQARRLTALPIFLAGGITLENMDELAGTGLNGVALISAILKADDPQSAAQVFKQKLKAIKNS